MPKDLLELEIENVRKLEELEEIKERIIDANCNMLSRIISFCEKNSIPFDNGLRLLLSDARKVLNISPEVKRSFFYPGDGTEPEK